MIIRIIGTGIGIALIFYVLLLRGLPVLFFIKMLPQYQQNEILKEAMKNGSIQKILINGAPILSFDKILK